MFRLPAPLSVPLLAAALSLALALPATAQPAAPTPPSAPQAVGQLPGMAGFRFALRDISPEGQAIMREALGGLREDGTREGIQAARERMIALLGAERLDVAALQRVMLEERNLVMGQHSRVQNALLAAFQRLSPEDRRTFAAGASEARVRLDERRRMWRERMKRRTAPQG